MASNLVDISIVRNPFQNNVVTPNVAANAPRPIYGGCGCSPVPYNTQESAAGPSLAGLGRSGSMVRAGRYQGALGRMVSNEGGPIRARAMRGVRGVRGIGDIPCGTIRDVTTVTNAVTGFVSGLLTQSNSKSSLTAATTINTISGGANAAVGAACPQPTAPAVQAAPPPATGSSSEMAAYQTAILKMMQDQQIARQAAVAQAQSKAMAAEAESSKTVYVVGGIAAVALLAVVLLK